ncbi:hypothetical protein GQ42DRAFT_168446 [Ramicandelaber brevisporus]|nr:hypothetical protein GQ42DRAFT_168446 [Ramicandelaber brevisporus]
MQCDKASYEHAFLSFPLLSLPLEMLWVISVFFAPAEAVRVLPVNRTIHDEFSRVVWYRMTTSKLTTMSTTTLERYGKFIRKLIVDCDSFEIDKNAHLLLLVRHIHFEPGYLHYVNLCNLGQMDFLGQLDEVSLDLTHIDAVGAKLTRDWINSSRLSGKVRTIRLNLDNSQISVADFLFIVDGINISHHHNHSNRFIIDYNGHLDLLPPTYITKLAPSLISLRFSNMNEGWMTSFGNTMALFPLVTRISLNLICQSNVLTISHIFTPTQFPSANGLYISISHFQSNDLGMQSTSVLAQFFSEQQPWLSITSLTISGCITEADNGLIAFALPNLTAFSYSSLTNTYKFSKLLPCFKLLQSFTLTDMYSSPVQHRYSQILLPNVHSNSRLRTVKLECAAITSEVLRFLYCTCHNVRELVLNFCTLSTTAVGYATETAAKNPPSNVRQITIGCSEMTECELWFELVSLFEQLNILRLEPKANSTSVDILQQFARHFPGVDVQLNPWTSL